ncbi:MAG: DUF4405 domain-containing protein [Candidatus Woesearchaeota archaeon]
MDKTKMNYWIDIAMAFSFVVTGITGLAIFFFMPQGQKSGQSAFLSISKQVWGDWHNWFGLLMIILMLVHLILHWDWLICMTKNMLNHKKICDNNKN